MGDLHRLAIMKTNFYEIFHDFFLLCKIRNFEFYVKNIVKMKGVQHYVA